MNYAPYVFTQEGVYDFSGNNLKYSSFKTIQNLKGDLNPGDFDHIFEKHYKEAEVVLYDYEIEVDTSLYARPMYFNIKKEWFLLFAPKDEYRFSHDNNNSIENEIIGQIDFLNFPAKFSDKRLIVLKDEKYGSYSINGKGQIINDEYLTTYFTQILNEKKYNYQTEDQIKIISRKKEEYYFMGSFLDLPDWIAPSFINTAYFRLSYQGEDLYFQEKAIKYFSKLKTSNNFYLYELPKQLRTKSNVAFLYYNLDIGGYRNDSKNLVEPIIKNAGLYIIKPKKTFRK